jgi:hypothetical protein
VIPVPISVDFSDADVAPFKIEATMICPECDGDTFVQLTMLKDGYRLCETCGEILSVIR